MKAKTKAERKPQRVRVNISLPIPAYRMGLEVADRRHRHFSGQVAAMIEAEYERIIKPAA